MNFKRLIILLLPLAVSSCVKELVVMPEKADWDIVMNASLSTATNSQTVYLSKAWSMNVKQLPGAELIARIGDQTYQATPVSDWERWNCSAYLLDMPLQPGETVTLTASRDGKKATATVTAPLPGTISNLKKLRLIKHVWFTADLTDPGAEENYFLLEAFVRYWQKAESGYSGYTDYLDIDVRTDAVLMDGSPVTGGGDSMIGDVTELLYGDERIFFSDRHFTGGKASVRFSAEAGEFGAGGESGQKVSAIFRLTTCSKEHYRYLKAVAAADVLDEPELMMFIEPVTIPCNVKGGLGFVSAVSCNEAEIVVTEE